MPVTTPPRSAIYRTAERAVGGDMVAWLTDQRGSGTSFSRISGTLRDFGVDVTYETVRSWCARLSIATSDSGVATGSHGPSAIVHSPSGATSESGS